MILVDTGPLIALFDPGDEAHQACYTYLQTVRDPLFTTTPVLTEAFHILDPASRGADNLRAFVRGEGLTVWPLDPSALKRAFELMEKYRDHPMDLADASIIAGAEALGTRTVFTLDRADFSAYRVRRGHRHLPVISVP